MNINNTFIATANQTEIQAESHKTATALSNVTKETTLNPLPQNRPIAANTSKGIDEVMGYLD